MTTHLTVVPDLEEHRARFWYTDMARLANANLDAYAGLVKRQRLALGLTLRAVSARCNVHHVAVMDLENRKYTTAQPRTIREISVALGLKADDLRAYIAEMADRELEEAA